MFRGVRWRGAMARITWGYFAPATVYAWTVQRQVDARTKRATWTLEATPGVPFDRFALTRGSHDRERPLLFTVPRKGGFIVWPILSITSGLGRGENRLVAALGPPEA